MRDEGDVEDETLPDALFFLGGSVKAAGSSPRVDDDLAHVYHRARSLQRLHVLTDVVDPEEERPARSKDSDGDTRCDRAGESIGITEAYRGSAFGTLEHRPAKGHELVKAGKLDVVLRVLAEADPGVETDVLFGNPGRSGEGEPVFEGRPSSETTSS